MDVVDAGSAFTVVSVLAKCCKCAGGGLGGASSFGFGFSVTNFGGALVVAFRGAGSAFAGKGGGAFLGMLLASILFFFFSFSISSATPCKASLMASLCASSVCLSCAGVSAVNDPGWGPAPGYRRFCS